jgi:hypothetical protein
MYFHIHKGPSENMVWRAINPLWKIYKFGRPYFWRFAMRSHLLLCSLVVIRLQLGSLLSAPLSYNLSNSTQCRRTGKIQSRIDEGAPKFSGARILSIIWNGVVYTLWMHAWLNKYINQCARLYVAATFQCQAGIAFHLFRSRFGTEQA